MRLTKRLVGILCFMLSITVNAQVQSPIPLKAPLTANSSVNVLLQAASSTLQAQGHATNATQCLKWAVAQHSGLAAMRLGDSEAPHAFDSAWHYYTYAARWGYPSAYHKMALLLQGMHHSYPRAQLRAKCYDNLSRLTPNAALVTLCQQKLGAQFVEQPNQGIQNAYEASLKVASDMKIFCAGKPSRFLSPRLSHHYVVALRHQFCHNNVHPLHEGLEKGAIVMQHHGLYVTTSTGTVPYTAALRKGQPVYILQPRHTVGVFDGKRIVPANEGTVLDLNGKRFTVLDNRLVANTQGKATDNKTTKQRGYDDA